MPRTVSGAPKRRSGQVELTRPAVFPQVKCESPHYSLPLISGPVSSKSLSNKPAARISHRWSTASPQTSFLAALRSLGLLDVLHEYDCGGLGRKPCQDGPCGASLRQAMRNPG